MVLERVGLEVITLDSPFHFNTVLGELKPDLALVDVTMPGFSGDHMVNFARRQLGALCPIVLFSERSEQELAWLAIRCGAAGYIRKSPDWSQVVASVRRFLTPPITAVGQRGR